jgi:peptidoglycan hydrolase-like protein with peptidoglycan-binding domain
MSNATKARAARRGARCLAATLALATVLVTGSAVAVAEAPSSVPAPAAGTVVGLRYGAYGEQVRVLQRALIRVGVGVKYGVDGYFGSATRASVKAFQGYKGLPVTGVVDGATARALGLGAPPPTPVTGGTLIRGATGERVRELQRLLVNAGIQVPGGIDGVFGAGTESAVKTFQRSRGFVATGRADAATMDALRRGTRSVGSSGLGQGSRGAAVRALQQALIAAGIPVAGGADGVFGPATAAAVRRYQRSRGLPVTGRADATTLNALGSRAPAVSPGGGGGGGGSGNLARGARGEAVRRLQLALMRAGIFVAGGADGIFGPATEQALKTYQRRKGFPATGRLDAQTARALGLDGGSPAPDNPTSVVGLKLGSRGAGVVAVQRVIIRAGIRLFGGADGVFGMATQSALMLYQRARGLPASGVVDSATARAMGLGGGGGGTPPDGGGDRGGGGGPGGPTASGYPRFDERGARVVALQQALVRAGIPLCGGVDGAFGRCTANALMQFQRTRGLAATGRVDQATANALGLRPAPAPSPPSPVNVRLDHVPVKPPCWFGDTWMAPRGGGRVHLGVDIIAARGQRVYAVTSGRISQIYRDRRGSLSGNGLKIARADGTYFFYAHLQRFASGIALGTPVTAGQVVGFVGSTGNSATPHLHFEVHPGGGAAVNPTPIVRASGAC